MSEVSKTNLKEKKIHLKTIYWFDNDLKYHSLKILEQGSIGILKEGNNTQLMRIKRGKGGFYYKEIQSS